MLDFSFVNTKHPPKEPPQDQSIDIRSQNENLIEESLMWIIWWF